MSTAVQRRRGTNTEHDSFTGLEGEISVNTTNESLHVHDGSTAGGFEMARADMDNVANIDDTIIGATTPAAGTFTTFTSNGIDDNATEEVLELADGLITLGKTAAAAQAIVATPQNDGLLWLNGGTAGNSGANLLMYGGTHASRAYDFEHRRDSTVVLSYDDSGDIIYIPLDDFVVGSTTAGATSAVTAYADGKLKASTGSSGASAAANFDELVIEGSGNAGASVLGQDSSVLAYSLGTPSNSTGAFLRWDFSNLQAKVGSNHVGGSTIVTSGAGATNLTLSGASGSELATFAGDVVVGGTASIGNALNNPEGFTYTQSVRGLLVAGATSGEAVQYMHRDDVTISAGNILGVTYYTGADGVDVIGASARAESVGSFSASSGASKYIIATTPSGSTSPVDALTVDSSGNLLLNTANSPTTTKAIISADYSVGGTENTGLTIAGRQSGNWYNNGIHALGASGLVFSTGTTGTNGADASNERMRIDSSGNVLAGKTVTSEATAGHTFGSTGYAYHTANGGMALSLNRLTSDGDVLRIRQDTATIGTLGTLNNNFQIKSNGSGFISLNQDVDDPTYIFRETSTASDEVLSVKTNVGGTDTTNFTVRADGGIETNAGIYLGGTGSANLLDDYEEGTFTPELADAFSGGSVATMTSAVGRYTKTGNHAEYSIRLNDINTTGMTGANTLFVRALPFTSSTSNRTTGAPMVDRFTYGGQIVAYIAASVSYLLLTNISTGAQDSLLTVAAVASAGSDLELSIGMFI